DYHGAYFAEDEEQHSVKGGESPQDSGEPTPMSENKPFENGHRREDRRGSDQSHRSLSPTNAATPTNAFAIAEMFIFSYGVVVFWNFSERQEKDVLADLTFSS